jgi:hypothetical protein
VWLDSVGFGWIGLDLYGLSRNGVMDSRGSSVEYGGKKG